MTRAMAPTLSLLRHQHRIVHAQDLITVHEAMLMEWGVPKGLARSIVHVVQALKQMEKHARPVTIMRHVAHIFPSDDTNDRTHHLESRPSTQDTIAYDTYLTARIETPMIVQKSKDDMALETFLELKARLYDNIVPPPSMDTPVFELFFQAFFLLLPADQRCHDHEVHALHSLHFDAFVRGLVDITLDVNASRRKLKDRCQRASTLARSYSNLLTSHGCHCVRHLVRMTS